eukprot:615274_1
MSFLLISWCFLFFSISIGAIHHAMVLFSNRLQFHAQAIRIQDIPFWKHQQCDLMNHQIAMSQSQNLCFVPIQNRNLSSNNVTIGRAMGEAGDGFEVYSIGPSIVTPSVIPTGDSSIQAIPFRYACRLHFSLTDGILHVNDVGVLTCINVLENGKKMHGYHLMEAVTSIADALDVECILTDSSSASFTTFLLNQKSYYQQFGFEDAGNQNKRAIKFFNEAANAWFLNCTSDKFEETGIIQRRYNMDSFAWREHSVGHLLLSHRVVEQLRRRLRDDFLVSRGIEWCLNAIGYQTKQRIDGSIANGGEMRRPRKAKRYASGKPKR